MISFVLGWLAFSLAPCLGDRTRDGVIHGRYGVSGYGLSLR